MQRGDKGKSLCRRQHPGRVERIKHGEQRPCPEAAGQEAERGPHPEAAIVEIVRNGAIDAEALGQREDRRKDERGDQRHGHDRPEAVADGKQAVAGKRQASAQLDDKTPVAEMIGNPGNERCPQDACCHGAGNNCGDGFHRQALGRKPQRQEGQLHAAPDHQ